MNPELARKAAQLRDVINSSSRIVFFGGAGVSTESGIPDFRSEESRRASIEQFDAGPEEVLSSDFFYTAPKTFYQYVKELLYRPDAEPNEAHRALAELEQRGVLTAVITQNIDGLHQKGGSENVLELHGTLSRYRCVDCAEEYQGDAVHEALVAEGAAPIPTCTCGGMLKPEVTLYGESLPPGTLEAAADAVAEADTLIVAGTSLAVYPAAGLVPLFSGKNLVVINLSPTPADSRATLVIHGPVGEVLGAAVQPLPAE